MWANRPKLSISGVNSSISCGCEIPHTLRCDGAFKTGRKHILESLFNHVNNLPEEEEVTF